MPSLGIPRPVWVVIAMIGAGLVGANAVELREAIDAGNSEGAWISGIALGGALVTSLGAFVASISDRKE